MPDSFSSLYFDDSGSAKALITNIHSAIENGAKSVFVLCCDENPFSPEEISTALPEIETPIFGGVFPQIIHQNKNHSVGSLVCGINSAVLTCEVSGLSNEHSNFEEQIQSFSESVAATASLIVLVDGLSSCIAAFLEDCYGIMGPSRHYIGGGAGSLSFEQKPCIFTNRGLEKDIAQIVAIDIPIKCSIEHGWSKLAGPFLVSSANKNVIHSLDYQPAFTVYKEIVEQESGKTFSSENFFDIAKEFPFGLSRANDEVIVRDPLKHIEDDLVCVGEVPENNLIYILKGEAEKLINASKTAANILANETNILNPALFFDCISRVLFLENRFNEELECVDKALPDFCQTIGALTLGEISGSDDACIEFYNKTAVLGIFTDEKQE